MLNQVVPNAPTAVMVAFTALPAVPLVAELKLCSTVNPSPSVIAAHFVIVKAFYPLLLEIDLFQVRHTFSTT